MKTIVKAWIAKAEGDFNAAQRCLRARPRSFDCHACFHAYECADKYLKAILAEHAIRFRSTLALGEAYGRLEKGSPEWRSCRAPAEFLNRFDDSILYPGRTARRREAQAALAACQAIREQARRSLRVPVPARCQARYRITGK